MSDKGRDPHSPMNNVNWGTGIVAALLIIAILLAGIVNTPALDVIASIPGNIGAIVNRAGVEGITWPWSGGCVHHPLMTKDAAALYCAGKKGLVIPLPGQNEGAVGSIVGGGSAQVSLDTAVRQYKLGAWDGANGACALADTALAQAVSEGNTGVQSQAQILVNECAVALNALQGLQTCNPLTDPVGCIMYADEVLKRHTANRQAADIRAVAYKSQEWENLRQQASQFRYDGESDEWSQQWPPTRRQQLLDLLWKRRFSIIDGIDIGVVRNPADDVKIAMIDVPSYTPTGVNEPVSAAPIEFTVPLGVIAELMGNNPDDMDPGTYQGWDKTHQLGTIPGGYTPPPDPQPIPAPPAEAPLNINPQQASQPPAAAPVEAAPVLASPSCVVGTVVPADWPVYLFDPTSGFPTDVTGQVSAAGAVLTGEFVGEETKILCKTNLQIADGRWLQVWPGPLFGWTR